MTGTDQGSSGRRPLTVGLGLAVVVLVLDQATKLWVLAAMQADPGAVAVTPFLNLVLVLNPGISFGLFDGGGTASRWILTGVAVAIVVWLLVWLRRAGSPVTVTGIGLIVGGALGNMADRVRIGAVVDFLDVHAWGYHWPAFNVADAGITVGVVALLADSLFGRRE